MEVIEEEKEEEPMIEEITDEQAKEIEEQKEREAQEEENLKHLMDQMP